MMFRKISIVGVGLIGGSIGMACRKKKIAGQVTGVFRRSSSMNKAKRLRAIDEGTLNLKHGIKGADLIIIATPTETVPEKLKECVRYASGNVIIIDVTSVKEKIIKAADTLIKNKKNISFVGTHPMAGSEESGVLMARPDLFRNSICIITPSKSAKGHALSRVRHFWERLGSRTEIMPALKHDTTVGIVSHLPHLLAYSMCAFIPFSTMRLSGPGFKDLTRIAKSNPDMWLEIFMQNKSSIMKAKVMLDENIKLLQSYIIKNDRKNLLKILKLARQKRESIG